MSSRYEMAFTIRDWDKSRTNDIIGAVEDEFDIELDRCDYTSPELLFGRGEYYLWSNQTEETFAQEVTLLIWKANGNKPCWVEIVQYYLEDPPSTTYISKPDDAHLLKRLEQSEE